MAFNVGDPTTAFVLRTGKVLERLSEERLSVKGLPEKKYTWKIDDKKVGDFTSQELAAGINLGARDADAPASARGDGPNSAEEPFVLRAAARLTVGDR